MPHTPSGSAPPDSAADAAVPDAADSAAHAAALDADDPLAAFRDRVVVADPDLLYLDGNSLGRLPRATSERLRRVVDEEWGARLVRGWQGWVDLPRQVGDLLGRELLGVDDGQVLVCDSTTVNLYKLAHAAVTARPGRRVVVTDDDNFPTDRYVLGRLAEDLGLQLRVVHSDLDEGVDACAVTAALDGDVALLSLSHTAYRSGALTPTVELDEAAHAVGALTLWDLSHSAGAVPCDLSASDLAVGCSYKYLNAGPGAPAWLYVRRGLADGLRTPVAGWFGQADQFAMDAPYRPRPGVGRFLTGTPSVLGLACVEEGVRLLAEAGPGRLRAKGVALTDYVVQLSDAWLAPHGVRLASPRQASRRGSHVTLHHPRAWQLAQALLARGVVPDYREPQRLRLGPAPLYTSFTEVRRALLVLRSVLEEGAHLGFPERAAGVT